MIPAPSPATVASADRAELRYDAPFANKYVLGVQPYVYFEAGQTWYIQRGAAIDPSLIDQYINSVGGGVRLTLPYNAPPWDWKWRRRCTPSPAAMPARKQPSSLSQPVSGSKGEKAAMRHTTLSLLAPVWSLSPGAAAPARGRARRSGRRHGRRSRHSPATTFSAAQPRSQPAASTK